MEYLGQPTIQYQGVECVVIHQPDGDKEDIFIVPKDDWELIVSECNDIDIDIEETYEQSCIFYKNYNDLQEDIEDIYEVEL